MNSVTQIDDVEGMTDDVLVQRYDRLTRLQEAENEHGIEEVARRIAARRMDLWNEAESRGIEARLL